MRTLAQVIENRTPLILPSNATVREACQRMRDQRMGAVLVSDRDKRLIGIFTGRDAVCRVLAEGRSPFDTALEEVMTRTPSALAPQKTAIDAFRLMRDGGFRHVPVVQAHKAVGIVSRADFMGIEIDRLDEEIGLWEKM